MSGKSQLIADGAAWFGNVSTSVAIIFVNKVLMNTTGYGFRYGAGLLGPLGSGGSVAVTCRHSTQRGFASESVDLPPVDPLPYPASMPLPRVAIRPAIAVAPQRNARCFGEG